MLPRFYVGEELPLRAGSICALPEGVSRHIQVLRLQPGAVVQLFDGQGREHAAVVQEMGRKTVSIEVGDPVISIAELPVRVTLAVGMPTNDRMDALVEKATELGAYAIQPLVCERSVLRLDGERAAKKVAHWQAVAVSACEQSGRAVVPRVAEIKALSSWVASPSAGLDGQPESEGADVHRGMLSLRDAVTLTAWLDGRGKPADHSAARSRSYVFLSGPEGGFSEAEERAALGCGWTAVTLGPRVLRADTAPLAALSVMASRFEGLA